MTEKKQKKAKILIVDDEESVRYCFQWFLINSGFDVETASNVEDAKKMLLEIDFNVAIIDNIFPGGQNGTDFIAYLNSVNPSCKAILISGYKDHSTSEKCDIFATLYKPAKQQDLCSIVNKAVAQLS